MTNSISKLPLSASANSSSRNMSLVFCSLLALALLSGSVVSVQAQSERAVSSVPPADKERVSKFWQRVAAQQERLGSVSATYDVNSTTPPNPNVDVEKNVARLTQVARESPGFAPELEKSQQASWREAFRKAREGSQQQGQLKIVRQKDLVRTSYSVDFGQGSTRVSDALLTPKGTAVLAGDLKIASAYLPGDARGFAPGVEDPLPLFLSSGSVENLFPSQQTQVTFTGDEVVLQRVQGDPTTKSASPLTLKLSAQTLRPLAYEVRNKNRQLLSRIEAKDYNERTKGVWVPNQIVVSDATNAVRAQYKLRESVFDSHVDPIVLRLPAQTQVNDYRAGEKPVIYQAKDGQLLSLDKVQSMAEKQQEKQDALAQMKAEDRSTSASRLYLLGAFMVIAGLSLIVSRHRHTRR